MSCLCVLYIKLIIVYYYSEWFVEILNVCFGAMCCIKYIVMAEMTSTPGTFPENEPFLKKIVAITNVLVYRFICTLEQHKKQHKYTPEMGGTPKAS